MTDQRIKAILFDLGETLVTFGKASTTRLFRRGARLSYDYLGSCGQSVGSFEYYCWRNLLSLRLWYMLSCMTGRDFNSLALLRNIGSRRGVKLDKDQWQHFAWLWYKPLSEVAQVEPDIRETLTTLKNMGLKLGILSNTFVTGYSLEKHLSQLEILDFFPVRLYSYQFKFRKPDVRIFRAATEQMGELFENMLFVGDRIDKDIKPAVKLGMRAVLKSAYTNKGKKTPDGVWKVERLSELPGLVEQINGGSKRCS
jgi:HAD superfamily hydrolase (TIGR01549 family)